MTGADGYSQTGFFLRIGVDIGGTKIVAGLVDDGGRVVYSKKIVTGRERGYARIRQDILDLLQDIMNEFSLSAGGVENIGIATAGQVERSTEVILFSPNLNWSKVPLRDDIQTSTGIRTHVENDVNAATYGEWRFSLCCVPQNVLGVFIGTGVGGGLILDGRLYRGYSNIGGEVGHITLNPKGYRCNCGNTGCFEAYCGGLHIVERVSNKIKEGYQGVITTVMKENENRLHAGMIEEAYLRGDEACTLVWLEVIEYLGTAISGLVNLLNPEVVILGGGVINGTRRLIDDMKVVVNRRALADSLKGFRIEKAKLGDDAALLGVSCIVE